MRRVTRRATVSSREAREAWSGGRHATASQRGGRVLLVPLMLLIMGAQGTCVCSWGGSHAPDAGTDAGTEEVDSGPGTTVSVTLSSTVIRMGPSDETDIVATVHDSSLTPITDYAVNWTVAEGGAGGRLTVISATSDGTSGSSHVQYVSPQTPGTFHIVATSVGDDRAVASVEVQVKPFWVEITPSQTVVHPSVGVPFERQFSAVVKGNTDPHQIMWSVVGGDNAESRGTISGSGLFTSPSAPPNPLIHVRAVAMEDPTIVGEASVFVTTEALPTITLSPLDTSLATLDILNFTATEATPAPWASAFRWSLITLPNSTTGGASIHGSTLVAGTSPGVFSVRVSDVNDPGVYTDAAVRVHVPPARPYAGSVTYQGSQTGPRLVSAVGDWQAGSSVADETSIYRLRGARTDTANSTIVSWVDTLHTGAISLFTTPWASLQTGSHSPDGSFFNLTFTDPPSTGIMAHPPANWARAAALTTSGTGVKGLALFGPLLDTQVPWADDATSYAVTAHGTTIPIQPGQAGIALFAAASSGDTFSFAALNGATTVSAPTPLTATLPTDGTSITGTVDLSSVSGISGASGLVVAAVPLGPPGVLAWSYIQEPAASQVFSIAHVQPGLYRVISFVDLNGDGRLALNEPYDFLGQFTGVGTLAPPALSLGLPDGVAQGRITTQNALSERTVTVTAAGAARQLVRGTITSSSEPSGQLVLPTDMRLDLTDAGLLARPLPLFWRFPADGQPPATMHLNVRTADGVTRDADAQGDGTLLPLPVLGVPTVGAGVTANYNWSMPPGSGPFAGYHVHLDNCPATDAYLPSSPTAVSPGGPTTTGHVVDGSTAWDFVGVPAGSWTAGQYYWSNASITVDGSTFRASAPGTSWNGPVAHTANVSDGTAKWTYQSPPPTSWLSGQSYPTDSLLKIGAFVYVATTGGTGWAGPQTAGVVTDRTVIWQHLADPPTSWEPDYPYGTSDFLQIHGHTYRVSTAGTSWHGPQAPSGTTSDGTAAWTHVADPAAGWTSDHSYASNDAIIVDGHVYRTLGGSSWKGPTGTSDDILDGSATWDFVSTPETEWTPEQVYDSTSSITLAGRTYRASADGTSWHGPQALTGTIVEATTSWTHISTPTTAWAPGYPYGLNDSLTIDGHTYRASGDGTSWNGPQTTGTGIEDGTAEWDFVSAVGTWASDHAYAAGDAILSGANTWVVTATSGDDHSSTGMEPAELSDASPDPTVEDGSVTWTLVSPWQPDEAYTAGDFVVTDTGVFSCAEAGTTYGGPTGTTSVQLEPGIGGVEWTLVDPWAPDTGYTNATSFVVTAGGLYQCAATGTSYAGPTTITTETEPGDGGVEWTVVPAWEPGTTYAETTDFVVTTGGVYECVDGGESYAGPVGTTADQVEPGATPVHWLLVPAWAPDTSYTATTSFVATDGGVYQCATTGSSYAGPAGTTADQAEPGSTPVHWALVPSWAPATNYTALTSYITTAGGLYQATTTGTSYGGPFGGASPQSEPGSSPVVWKVVPAWAPATYCWVPGTLGQTTTGFVKTALGDVYQCSVSGRTYGGPVGWAGDTQTEPGTSPLVWKRVPAWTFGTTYTTSSFVVTSGGVYQCSTAGVSAGLSFSASVSSVPSGTQCTWSVTAYDANGNESSSTGSWTP